MAHPSKPTSEARLGSGRFPLRRYGRAPQGERLHEWRARARSLGGVTNYLDAPSLWAVFDLVARICATGSRMIFTDVHAGLLDGRFQAAWLVHWSRHAPRARRCGAKNFPGRARSAVFFCEIALAQTFRVIVRRDEFPRCCPQNRRQRLGGRRACHPIFRGSRAGRRPG